MAIRCDACGAVIDADNYCTDDSVCGGTNGPGFYLCYGAECSERRWQLSLAERTKLYGDVRRRNTTEQTEQTTKNIRVPRIGDIVLFHWPYSPLPCPAVVCELIQVKSAPPRTMLKIAVLASTPGSSSISVQGYLAFYRAAPEPKSGFWTWPTDLESTVEMADESVFGDPWPEWPEAGDGGVIREPMDDDRTSRR